MIESYLVDLLEGRLDDVHVGTKVPKTRPDTYVRLSRAGGPRRDLVTDMPMVIFECYAVSEPDAEDLAEQCRRIVHAEPYSADSPIRRVVETGGPVNFPDPDTSLPRYQFTVQLNVRSEAF